MKQLKSQLWDSSVTGERDNLLSNIHTIDWRCSACGKRIHYEKENMMEFYWTREDGIGIEEFIGYGPNRYIHAKEPCPTLYVLSLL